jgi:tetratricopeptide (TPR) repeat protein
MYYVLVLNFLILSGAQQTVTENYREKVTIINGLVGSSMPYEISLGDLGPSTGHMLSVHFIPGINYYNNGRYDYAQGELNYVTIHPEYLMENPRRSEIESIAHYLIGMIYMYHADGVGRRTLAKQHFEKAIEWNPDNHMAYLEMARMYASLRLSEPARAILQQLLKLKPPGNIEVQARDELSKLSSTDK